MILITREKLHTTYTATYKGAHRSRFFYTSIGLRLQTQMAILRFFFFPFRKEDSQFSYEANGIR